MMFPKRVYVVLSVVLAALCLGGAVAVFLLASDDGLVFEGLLVVIALLSLAMGAIIARRQD